ncbi:MAG TPA: hypothetical protein P5114_04595 [Hyphomicrobiaceae bacterium]|nr:hypothetical protein [Hyphomicrobiaceae bacterium]
MVHPFVSRKVLNASAQPNLIRVLIHGDVKHKDGSQWEAPSTRCTDHSIDHLRINVKLAASSPHRVLPAIAFGLIMRAVPPVNPIFLTQKADPDERSRAAACKAA